MDSENAEIWRAIAGFPNYEVSSHGRVRNVKTRLIKSIHIINSGYHTCNLWKDNKGKSCLVHRLVAHAFLPNPNNLRCVDHINRHKTDNNVNNLRFASHAMNQWNSEGWRNAASSYKGVTWHKSNGKWRARIRVDGQERSLGYFDDEVAASRAYDVAAQQMHGIFAKLNNA